MYLYTILSCYAMILMMLVLSIWYLWKVFKKKTLIKLTVKPRTEKRIDVILKIVLGIWFLVFYVKGTVPAIKDIPYILTDNLKEIKGVAVSSDKRKNDADWHLRSFVIDDGENEISVRVRTNQVEKGDYFEVRYLPNTHLGEVLEREETKNHG